VAFELAYLKLGIHRSMAQHSCQVTYYNISSPVLCTPAHTRTFADSLSKPLHPLTRRTTLRHRRRRRRRCVLRLSVSNIYTDSRRARGHARARVISLICMCSSSKGEQNHPNIFTRGNRMYSRGKTRVCNWQEFAV